jgi:hypothetical protein
MLVEIHYEYGNLLIVYIDFLRNYVRRLMSLVRQLDSGKPTFSKRVGGL